MSKEHEFLNIDNKIFDLGYTPENNKSLKLLFYLYRMQNQASDKISLILINSLSPHLFWDVDENKIDPMKNKKWIIRRVLSYGLFTDWQLIYNFYGLSEIASIAVQIEDLDKKTVSFISVLANIPIENFICYTLTPSKPKHWNF